MDPSNIGMVTIGAIQGIVIYTTLMPERSSLKQCNPADDHARKDLRHAEVMSGGLTLGLVVMLSILSKSILPFWIGVATIVALTAAYEITFHMREAS